MLHNLSGWNTSQLDSSSILTHGMSKLNVMPRQCSRQTCVQTQISVWQSWMQVFSRLTWRWLVQALYLPSETKHTIPNWSMIIFWEPCTYNIVLTLPWWTSLDCIWDSDWHTSISAREVSTQVLFCLEAIPVAIPIMAIAYFEGSERLVVAITESFAA